MAAPTPADIRAAQADHPKLRDRDLAAKIGISEAQLVVASCGMGATRIDPHPGPIMAAAQTLDEVMALTRTDSCVHERAGIYDNYHPGAHASMVLTEDIDLRIFPSHWCHAYMVEKEAGSGTRRSFQVFDAAGDAVHKVFLRDTFDLAAWDTLRADLPLNNQSQTLAVEPRKPTEAPKADTSKLDILQKEWARMTDTLQLLRLTSKLKMNRLGAVRAPAGDWGRQSGA